ncbi:hypothetical protein F4556_005072 [Kitasatospora gansuensis]|uniref:Uncharacterized protein n=1 Tax=Kitasatospora gansuensis TaxID=258050 RepID=A0A7W7SG96_9ACTN|nr:hypothetical protein [Kitasatospora gansuensis]MBB4949537.1 hypothetical protein [Kitasatospora gansuensis]
MLPALITTNDSHGRWTYALDYSSILDPLVRAIAIERAGSEDVDRDLDEIAQLAGRVKAAPDEDAADSDAAELSWRVDQFVASLGHGRRDLPAEPNRFDIGNARVAALNMRAMADALTAWADRHTAAQAA